MNGDITINVDITVIVNLIQSEDETQSEIGTLFTGVNTVVGVLANWFQVVTTLLPIIENAISKTKDPQCLLGEIETHVQQFELEMLAEDAKRDKIDFDKLLTLARGHFEVLRRSPNWKTDPLVIESSFFTDVYNAAFVFQDPDAYWTRPYVQEVTFFALDFLNNGRPQVCGPGGPYVYDPRLAMPAFVAAIDYYTEVVTIFFADSDATEIVPFFTDLAGILQREHDRATAGLVTVPIPSLDELTNLAQLSLNAVLEFNIPETQSAKIFAQDGASLRPSLFLAPFYSYWFGEVGVVDIYGIFGPTGYASSMEFALVSVTPTTNAANVIDVYPTLGTLMNYMIQGLSDPSQNLSVNVYRWFRIRMRLGNLARFKAFYIAKGYDRVWVLIQQLRRLAKGSAGTDGLLPPPVEVTDHDPHWSLAEIDSIIGEWDHDQHFGGGYYSAKFVCAYSPADDTPAFCAHTGASAFVTAESVIAKLRGVLNNSTNHPMDGPFWPVYSKPLPRPLKLRETILAVAI